MVANFDFEQIYHYNEFITLREREREREVELIQREYQLTKLHD